MSSNPQYVYNPSERTVYVNDGESKVELYTDVSQPEFETLESVEAFAEDTSSLLDRLLHTMLGLREGGGREEFYQQVTDLQAETVTRFEKCRHYQEAIKARNSEVLNAQLGQLYKLEKLLKRYLRALSISQSIGFSQRLHDQYNHTDDHLYLYGYVRNVYSTIEYLGKVLINRLGEHSIGLDEAGTGFREIYETLREEDLLHAVDDTHQVPIPPTGRQMTMGDLTLNQGSIEYLRTKRNNIVHHCPLVVDEDSAAHLPDDLLSTIVFTNGDTRKLLELSSRLHFQSIGLFVNYLMSFQKELLEQLVEAWFHEQ
ncbi:hypothetical protein [Halorubellus sp. PRR65]|uniref:hypothetical protein n=1 Tax=Halorubellus sp. PRR65 TaxID=3098148 RepID=UPI002B264200|nr:hypothetical protein [Halorubellus sp. PRR65]